MRAGENRGILSRVLTIYKQTFIFQIFHLLFFWKLKAPSPPPLQTCAAGRARCHTTRDTGSDTGNMDSTLPQPHQAGESGWGKPQDLSSEAGAHEAAEKAVCCSCSKRNPLASVRIRIPGFTQGVKRHACGALIALASTWACGHQCLASVPVTSVPPEVSSVETSLLLLASLCSQPITAFLSWLPHAGCSVVPGDLTSQPL